MTCVSCKKEWEWEGDPNETALEKLAYFYPRTVHYVATSQEAHANDKDKLDEIKSNISAGGIAALILSPALLITIPTIIPALLVTAGRKTKQGIEELIERLSESDDD
jgi:hypothetical protein